MYDKFCKTQFDAFEHLPCDITLIPSHNASSSLTWHVHWSKSQHVQFGRSVDIRPEDTRSICVLLVLQHTSDRSIRAYVHFPRRRVVAGISESIVVWVAFGESWPERMKVRDSECFGFAKNALPKGDYDKMEVEPGYRYILAGRS